MSVERILVASDALERIEQLLTPRLTGRALTITVSGPQGSTTESDMRLVFVRVGEIRPFGTDGFEIVYRAPRIGPQSWHEHRKVTWHVDFWTTSEAVSYTGPDEFNHTRVVLTLADDWVEIAGTLAERRSGANHVRIEIGPPAG